jgi:hypothetical protein
LDGRERSKAKRTLVGEVSHAGLAIENQIWWRELEEGESEGKSIEEEDQEEL